MSPAILLNPNACTTHGNFSTKSLLLAQAALNTHAAGSAFWSTLEGFDVLYIALRSGLKPKPLRTL